MNQILKLSVLDGSQVGQKIEVPSEKCSVGGQGSGADLELSGLPYGIKFIDLVHKGKNWSVVEFEPRSALLNQRQLKRRNKLSQGDEISLPSVTPGMPFRVTVELEAVKKQKGEAGNILGKVNGTMLALISVYLVAMVVAAVFLLFNNSAGNETRQIAMEDVIAALDADVAVIPPEGASAEAFVPLTNRASNYEDLALFLSQDISLARKTELTSEFKTMIVELFSEAWRLEKQQRWNDALGKYQKIADIMGDRDLKTTELALVKARQVNRR